MSWFEEDAGAKELESGTQENTPFYVESGEYVATIELAGVYETPDASSKGLYVRFKLDNGTTIDQYVNYINRKGEAHRVVKDEEGNDKKVKGIGLDQVESWDKVVDFGKPTVTTTATLWGSEREIKLQEKAVGKKVGVLVRHVKEFNQDETKVYDKNEVEMLFDLQTRKTSGELNFKEDDNRHKSISQWLEKIEKNPVLDRTNKKKKPEPSSTAKKEFDSAGW